MLKYRKLTDLTDEEIKFAINDILHPVSIGEIKRDYKWDTIDVDVTTDWGEDGETELITDTISHKIRKTYISKDLLENRIKDGAGLLNPLSYYLVKVGI